MREGLRQAVGWTTWAVGNARSWQATPPDYAVFVLGEPMPALPPQRPSWQRLLPAPPTLGDRLQQFERVADDPRVSGAVLHLRPLGLPLAHLQALRSGILALRARGKRVVAWGTHYDRGAYYVATAADEILLQPGGDIRALGIARAYVHLADGLARAGMSFEAVAISPYKTAADMFTRGEMSEAAREMADWLLDDERAAYLEAVSTGRGMGEEAAEELIDRSPLTDVEAMETGAVDAVVSEEELPRRLAKSGAAVRLERWRAAKSAVVPAPPPRGRDYVGLIRIEGLIVDGESASPPAPPPVPVPLVGSVRAGDLTVVQQARRALADDACAAVVVWIDSTGGSATASEAIAAALSELAQRKPVVVAMGAVAASGGYYVACPAHRIYAQPGTITGSLGVISGKLVTGDLLEKLGINRTLLQRGDGASMWDPGRGFSEAERAAVERSVRRIYDVFVERVATGRNKSAEAIDGVAGGRVWTGRQALDHGLIDAFGGLEEALATARELAGVSWRAPLHAVEAGKHGVAPNAPVNKGDVAGLLHVVRGIALLNKCGALCLAPLLPALRPSIAQR